MLGFIMIYDPVFLLIVGVFLLLGWIVSSTLKSKFKTYSKIPLPSGMTGRDVAEKMLADHNISGVTIKSAQGELTDHYHPGHKTVNLSQGVYSHNSVAAAAVAAHECGHAVQHARAYSFVKMRSALVPVVSFASKWVQWVLLAGILLVESFPQLLLAGILLFATMTLFSFITLPVEIDASRRALAWLNSAGITSGQAHSKAKSALRWAAYTYVVSALSSLATLLYYIMIYMGRRD